MSTTGNLSRVSYYVNIWGISIYGKEVINFYDQAAGSVGLYELGDPKTGTYGIKSINDNGIVVFAAFPNYPIVKVWVLY